MGGEGFRGSANQDSDTSQRASGCPTGVRKTRANVGQVGAHSAIRMGYNSYFLRTS
jgi:hypothetical protein